MCRCRQLPQHNAGASTQRKQYSLLHRNRIPRALLQPNECAALQRHLKNTCWYPRLFYDGFRMVISCLEESQNTGRFRPYSKTKQSPLLRREFVKRVATSRKCNVTIGGYVQERHRNNIKVRNQQYYCLKRNKHATEQYQSVSNAIKATKEFFVEIRPIHNGKINIFIGFIFFALGLINRND